MDSTDSLSLTDVDGDMMQVQYHRHTNETTIAVDFGNKSFFASFDDPTKVREMAEFLMRVSKRMDDGIRKKYGA